MKLKPNETELIGRWEIVGAKCTEAVGRG